MVHLQGDRGPSPHRRNRISPEFQAGYRRRRVTAAVADLAWEEGLHTLTVERLCRAAGVGRNTFYSLFRTQAECLEASFEAAFEAIFEPVRKAATEAPPSGRIEAAVGCFFATAASEQRWASLCLVHSFEARECARGHDYEAAVDVFASLLGGSSARAELQASAVVACAAASLRRRSEYLLPTDTATITSLIRRTQTAEFGCVDVQAAAM